MKKIILLIVVLTSILSFLNAQPGENDLTFNSSDIGFSNGDGPSASVNSTVVQSDGKILIVGTFTTYNGIARNGIARLNADGTLDNTFNPGTGASSVYCIAIQSDGKIIIVGGFTSCNGTARNRIARLNADGSLDTSFDPGTGAGSTVNTVAIQSNGKILIGGFFTSYNGTARSRIARINTDGSLDTGFNPGTGADNFVYAIAIQTDGKIVIGGSFTTYNGTSLNNIARLNSDGSIDAGFNLGTGANSDVQTIALQSDGKIVIGGNFTLYNGTGRNRIARLNTDGTVDIGFTVGVGPNDTVLKTLIQNDGKIIIAGSFMIFSGTQRKHIARLNNTGSIDTGFNPGTGADSDVKTAAFLSDETLMIGGDFTSINGFTKNYIAHINSDGSLETSFYPLGTGANSYIRAIAIQNDGKILIGGAFTSYNGVLINRIARLNTDGSIDNTFNPGTGTEITVQAISVQSDGKILIAGFFTTFNGVSRKFITRLNSDGSFDTSFNSGTGPNNAIQTISIQSDGKIIIGGWFNTYNGTARNGIARLNADGSLDTGFDPGTGIIGIAYATGIQSDGKIVVGGNFTSFNGSTCFNIIRLNTDGSVDANFNHSVGLDKIIQTLSIQSDGKIVVGGKFTLFAGTSRNRIARLNTNGTLDISFDPGIGISNGSSNVLNTSIQSDGKIIIGGTFPSYNGVARNNLARLNTDGSLDVSFDPGTGPNDLVNTTAFQSDGKIIVGGNFNSYNSIGRNRVLRIYNNIINSIPFGPATYCAGGTVSVNYTALGIFNAGNIFTAELSDASGSFATPTIIGTLSSTLSGTIVATIPIAQTLGTGYRIRIISSDPATISVDNGSNLIVQHSSSSSFTQTACDSYELNGTTYTTSGIFTQTLVNSVGCDSVITLGLTIKQSTNNTITQAVCDSYELNGTTYTTSGIFTQTLVNSVGCDSVITLDLTIKHSTNNSITQTVCDSYELNGTTYTISGNYSQTILNTIGCDSIITLDLTIKHSTNNIITQEVCESYELNGTTYTSSGIFTQHLTNIAGCDSTITLDLTINNSQSAGVDSTSNVCSNETLTIDLFDHLGGTYSMGGTWSDDDATGELTGSIFDAINVVQGLNYHFTYNVSNITPCVNSSATVTLYVVVCGGISMSEMSSINIYPNPVKSELTIETNSGIKQSFEIVNVMGQTVISSMIDKKTTVEMSQLPGGVYMVKLFNEKSTIIKRFVKE